MGIIIIILTVILIITIIKYLKKKHEQEINLGHVSMLKAENINLKNQIKHLKDHEKELFIQEEHIKKEQEKLIKKRDEIAKKVLDSANITPEEAQKIYFEHLDHEYKQELLKNEKQLKTQINLFKNKIAQDVILTSMQRLSHEISDEYTIAHIHLPEDENIKGKIIGRDGRNMRTFENLFGVNVLLSDEHSLFISSFDPIRRAIAYEAMKDMVERKIINQEKIETNFERATKKINDMIYAKGHEAIYELNLIDIPEKLVYIIGRLAFRTSYGQNCLIHSIECAKLAESIAMELNLDPYTAKTAAFFHDIGKATSQQDHESHVILGINLMKKYYPDPIVLNAISAHHNESKIKTPYDIITIVADTISSSRPGARNNSHETFVTKSRELEKIGNQVEGVKKAYALSSGRELRIIVESNKIKDTDLNLVARKIKEQIQSEIVFPGAIKINVLRENRYTTKVKMKEDIDGENR